MAFIYTIDKDEILDDVKYEVSRIALTATSQGDSSKSAFDSIDIKSGDDRMIGGFVDDGIENILSRFSDCTKKVNGTIEFNIPDFDESKWGTAERIITNYVSLYAATSWFIKRNQSAVESYNLKVQEVMDKLVNILRTRKRPAL